MVTPADGEPTREDMTDALGLDNPDPIVPAPTPTPAPDPTPAPAKSDEIVPPIAIPDDLLPPGTREIKPTPKPKPAAPAPITPKPGDEITLPPGIREGSPQGNAFKAMRLAETAALKRAEAAEEIAKQKDALIATLQSGKPQDADIELLKKTVKEKDDRLGQIDLVMTDQFQQKYDRKIVDLGNQLAEIVKDAGSDPAIIKQALSMKFVDRVKFLTEKVPDLVPVLSMPLMQIDTLVKERATTLQNWQANLPKFREEQLAQERQELETVKANAFADGLSALRQGKHFLLTESENEEWNAKVVRPLVERARTVIQNGDIKLQTDLMMKGTVHDVLLKMFHDERALRIKAQQELADRYRVRPGVSAGGSPIAHKTPEGQPQFDTIEEIAEHVASMPVGGASE
jgi:hypothetical protein